MSAAPGLRLAGLAKRYGPRVALRGIDLVLEGPQLVGIVGPDGAGKTTLLRAVAGLLEVEAREASVLGFDLRADVVPLKARVGYVPQTFGLQRDLSVIENLRFTARLHRIPEDEFRRRVDPLLERTTLAPFADRPAGALSGGMKQKLAVTNALLSEPDLLVLDEPTAGVDVVARDAIFALLDERRDRVLTLVSTSYLEEAALCDRLVYLDQGRVVASDTPERLRAAVPLDLFRAWGDAPREIARAARALPYVTSARASGRFARIEVSLARTPGAATVVSALRALPGVRLVEEVPVDTESMLLFLARATGEGRLEAAA
ncbi:MAG TPA: ABC transporter ATP-binding protein [Myxococcota bacterium]|nr:ABC transporter ATP-binding protein [Myxococcota bacterium]